MKALISATDKIKRLTPYPRYAILFLGDNMKVAIYSRKSKYTGKGESIENQVEICREYIHNNFPDVRDEDIAVYEDEGFSGKNTKRPRFQMMMEAEIKEHFDIIIVYRLDRISRSIRDFADLTDRIRDYGTKFISVKEQFDTTNSMGTAMMNVSMVFAQLERETIAERIRDNMLMLARTGRWLGGTPPLGYDSQQVSSIDEFGKARYYNKLVANDDKEKVKLIFGKFLETQSMTATTAYLIANDIKSVNNIDFTNFAIREILVNPVYCEITQDSYDYLMKLGCQMCFDIDSINGSYGFAVYNRKKSDSKGKRTGSNPPTEWIVAMGKHEPLITAKDWLHAQEICSINKKYSFHRKVHNKDSLLSGILYCGECGHKMRPKINSRPKADGTRSFFYMCEYKEFSRCSKCRMKNVNGEIIDRLVCESLFEYDVIGSVINNQVKELHGRMKKAANTAEEELKNINGKIGEINLRIKNLMGNLMKTSDDDVLYEYIKTEITELDKRLKELNALKEENLEKSKAANDIDGQYEFICNTLRNFKDSFSQMTTVQKRELLRNIISRVEWDGENAKIFLCGADCDK